MSYIKEPRLPTTIEELTPNTHNPEYIIALNKRFNEQSERIEALLASTYQPTYADILPWRERQAHYKAQGAAESTTAPRGCEVVDLSIEDEEADEQGYQEFLATEFSS